MEITMKTSLRGRVRNTGLPKKQLLMPLFEAVVNSIHAIEDSDLPVSSGSITVTVNRVPQDDLGEGIPGRTSNVVGFSIEDNGIGFNEANFESFRTLDTEYKAANGGHGIGRLSWIKCFRNVTVDSVFVAGGKMKRRIFSFDAQAGIHDHQEIELHDGHTPRTVINLARLRDSYQGKWPRNTEIISDQLFEHFLWYFLREEGCPKIVIRDGGVEICLRDRYSKEVKDSIVRQTIAIKSQEFSAIHVKLRSGISSPHFVALCADGRLVDSVSIRNKVLGLFERLEDSIGPFIHGSYVTSKFLDDRVQPEREGFDILDSSDLFHDAEISRDDLISSIADSVKNLLTDSLETSRKSSEERIHQFIRKTPNYRQILKHMSPEAKIVDPSISDSELELYFHREQQGMEHDLIEQGQRILRLEDGEQVEDHEQRIQAYIEKITDVNMSTLAKYVSHRRIIIDFLENAISSVDGQKYAREARIHQLIMPKGFDTQEVDETEANLWLVDERLAFHDYLASDKPLSKQPILDTHSSKRPDINALHFVDNPTLVSDRRSGTFSSLTIIELKRPMHQERDNPLEQTLGYLDAIRGGGVRTVFGRPIHKAAELFAYCYIIADLSDHVVRHCRQQDFTIMQDGAGYFRYYQNLNAYVEVISYDRLVSGARERNHAFFTKLGLPSSVTS